MIGIIAGVAAAIAGIIAIVKNWGAITEWFGNLWQTVSQKLMELWNGLAVFFTETIPAAFPDLHQLFFCHPGLVERPVVTGIRVFREYLERNPAESHCPAGGDNDYFFVGECEKYSAGDLVGICQIASGAFELLKNVILAPVLLLIDLVTGNFSSLPSMRPISGTISEMRLPRSGRESGRW